MPKPKTVAGTAEDPTIRYIKVDIDGQHLKLAYDFGNIALAESITGINLLSAFSLAGMNANQLRGLFFGCVLKAQPKMTLADVSKMFSLANMAKITQAIVDTWTASMPDQTDEPDPNDETPLAPASE